MAPPPRTSVDCSKSKGRWPRPRRRIAGRMSVAMPTVRSTSGCCSTREGHWMRPAAAYGRASRPRPQCRRLISRCSARGAGGAGRGRGCVPARRRTRRRGRARCNLGVLLGGTCGALGLRPRRRIAGRMSVAMPSGAFNLGVLLNARGALDERGGVRSRRRSRHDAAARPSVFCSRSGALAEAEAAFGAPTTAATRARLATGCPARGAGRTDRGRGGFPSCGAVANDPEVANIARAGASVQICAET